MADPNDSNHDPAPPAALSTAPTGGPGALQTLRLPRRLMTTFERRALLTYQAASVLLLVYMVAKLWPKDLGAMPADLNGVPREVFFGFLDVPVNTEVRLLGIVLIAGALGALVHTLRSYAAFAGNRQLLASWISWYFTRPLVGAVLALIFYLLVRGGLMPGSLNEGQSASVSIAGFAGAAGLVGLFSELAMSKLKQVFQVIFAHDLDEKDDPLKKEVPLSLEALEPEALVIGGDAKSLILKGKGFSAQSKVHFDALERPASLNAEGQLVVPLTAEDQAEAQIILVSVVNPESGERSGAIPLRVDEA